MTAVERLGRAYDLYRRTAATRSAILLLLANLIPLVGVLFFGWSLQTILVLYWIENGIVGFWNVPKIVLAQGSLLRGLGTPPGEAPTAAGAPTFVATGASQASGRGALGAFSGIPCAAFALALFFTFHYGMFWLVHGVFVFILPMFAADVLSGTIAGSGEICLDASGLPTACAASPFGELIWPAVIAGAIALFLSHGASFFLNYIGRGEYRTASPNGQMGAVYGRVAVLHLTILFGAFVIAFLGSPIGALLVLVVLKTAFDLVLHLREHRKAGPISPPAAPPPPPG